MTERRTYQAIGRDLDAAVVGAEQVRELLESHGEALMPAVSVSTMHPGGAYLEEALNAYLAFARPEWEAWCRTWIEERPAALRAELQGETRAAPFRERQEAVTGAEAAPAIPEEGVQLAEGHDPRSIGPTKAVQTRPRRGSGQAG